MKKRSATVISGAMVLALMAGMVGANRAVLHQAATASIRVLQRGPAPAHPAVPEPVERE